MDRLGEALVIVIVLIGIALFLSAVFNVFPANQLKGAASSTQTPTTVAIHTPP